MKINILLTLRELAKNTWVVQDVKSIEGLLGHFSGPVFACKYTFNGEQTQVKLELLQKHWVPVNQQRSDSPPGDLICFH